MIKSELTVIIPTWNRADLLVNCLSSLEHQTRPAEVIVVDNGSEDQTVQTVNNRYPECQCIQLQENLGFARAVNIGIQTAETPFIALLNNDTEADPHWIEAGLKGLSDNQSYSIFASRMIDYYDRNRLDSAGDCYGRSGLPVKRGFGADANAFPHVEAVIAASAGAAFYRREVFDRIGLLDETYFLYLEDVELSLRAQICGFRCLYLPDAVVYHIEGASDPDRKISTADRKSGIYSSKRVYWITRNRWQLMITYQPLQHIPWLAFGWIRSLAFHMIKAGYLIDFLKGLKDGMAKTGYALRRRNELKRIQKIKNRDLWRNRHES